MATTGVLLLWAVVQTIAVYRGAAVRGEVGWDAHVYAAIGMQFLETGHAYFAAQSAPYIAEGMVNIYPPTALYLFVPAAVAPTVLWWVVPPHDHRLVTAPAPARLVGLDSHGHRRASYQ